MNNKNQPKMIPARKLPRYIGVEKPAWRYNHDLYRIYITKRAYKTIPEWVRSRVISFFPVMNGENHGPGHRNHVYTVLTGKDEPEVYLRFCRLWQGLPSE